LERRANRDLLCSSLELNDREVSPIGVAAQEEIEPDSGPAADENLGLSAERTRRGQLRGSGREWDREIGDISSLPEKRYAEEVEDSISL